MAGTHHMRFPKQERKFLYQGKEKSHRLSVFGERGIYSWLGESTELCLMLGNQSVPRPSP